MTNLARRYAAQLCKATNLSTAVVQELRRYSWGGESLLCVQYEAAYSKLTTSSTCTPIFYICNICQRAYHTCLASLCECYLIKCLTIHEILPHEKIVDRWTAHAAPRTNLATTSPKLAIQSKEALLKALLSPWLMIRVNETSKRN